LSASHVEVRIKPTARLHEPTIEPLDLAGIRSTTEAAYTAGRALQEVMEQVSIEMGLAESALK